MYAVSFFCAVYSVYAGHMTGVHRSLAERTGPLVGRILVNFIPRYRSGSNANIRQPMLKLNTHSASMIYFLNKC
jgi:hypothetical protein